MKIYQPFVEVAYPNGRTQTTYFDYFLNKKKAEKSNIKKFMKWKENENCSVDFHIKEIEVQE